MAKETGQSDFFQILFSVAREILKPVLDIFSDPLAKEEFFKVFGIDSAADIGSMPGDANLRAYVDANVEDVDEFMLASAFEDFVQLSTLVERIVRLIVDTKELGDDALDELITTYANFLTFNYIRRRDNSAWGVAQLIYQLPNATAKEGGVVGVSRLLGQFLEPLISSESWETEEGAQALSFTVAALIAVLLYYIDEKWISNPKNITDQDDDDFAVIPNTITTSMSDNIDFAVGYGFEGLTASTTPNADRITNRSLSYSCTVRPHNSPDNQLTAFNTLTFVPEKHGGLAVVTELSGELDITVPISEEVSLKFDVGGDGIFRIGKGMSAGTGANNRAKITFKHKVNKPTNLRIFKTPEFRTGLKDYSFSLKVTPDDLDINASTRLPILIKKNEKAGFPQNFLPKEIKEEIPLVVGFSIKRGLYFGKEGSSTSNNNEATDATAMAGSAPAEEAEWWEKVLAKLLNKIDIRAALHKDIGGHVGLEVLNLKTSVAGNFQETKIETSIDFWVKFGSALTVSISRLGAELAIIKREDNGGFLGTDVKPQFKPPTGAGVVVDAKAVKGGGFLYFDDDAGEYFGALELEFKELVALKAVGIINTKSPEGEDIFSMLILVTGEFSPVSLAFGFTLDGVGGLLGVDRTVDVEALRLGVRTNAIKSILFPENVVGNMSRIISDIKNIFPVKKDQLVVGLMAKLGYGGTKNVSIEIGIILEVPDPKVAIVGVVKVVAPSEDKDALRLQVNFLGLLDFDNEFGYLEAHLYDSHLVGFPLTGTMALAIGWGKNCLFGVSVGGFHPDFVDYPVVPTLPGAFRNMDRLGLSLLDGDNPSLTLQCYLAVTSNSFQIGAKIELLAKGPMGFNLYGMVEFDAIFVFDPFSFAVRLAATLAIRKNRKILFGISFDGELSGTSPWHVEGEVSFGMLFFDVTIGFEETWGDRLAAIEAGPADLVGIVRRELRNERNWSVQMGRSLHHTVTHRALKDISGDQIVVYPFGKLSFSQREVPLNYKIDKLGTSPPLDEDTIRIKEIKIGPEKQSTRPIKELFAAGQYTNLSEQEKLSRKSFERFDGGFELSETDELLTAEPTINPTALDYELNYTDDDQFGSIKSGLDLKAFEKLKRHAGVATSELAWGRSKESSLNGVKAVAVKETEYVIASTTNLSEVAGGIRTTNYAEASAFLSELVANDATLVNALQIVEATDLAG